jgi:hypothetical protein
MRRLTHGFIAAALCALSVFSLQPAHAQNQPASPNISDQKLDATASAIAHVSDLQKSYQEKLASTPPADKSRVVAEANAALEKAVTDQGLSVEEYSTILQTAQKDPSLRDKLVQRLKTPAK